MPTISITGATIETTYSITVINGSTYPSIQATFHGANMKETRVAICIAHEAFCTIDVLNEQTGELCYSHQANDEFFSPSDTCGNVIDRISQHLYG